MDHAWCPVCDRAIVPESEPSTLADIPPRPSAIPHNVSSSRLTKSKQAISKSRPPNSCLRRNHSSGRVLTVGAKAGLLEQPKSGKKVQVVEDLSAQNARRKEKAGIGSSAQVVGLYCSEACRRFDQETADKASAGLTRFGAYGNVVSPGSDSESGDMPSKMSAGNGNPHWRRAPSECSASRWSGDGFSSRLVVSEKAAPLYHDYGLFHRQGLAQRCPSSTSIASFSLSPNTTDGLSTLLGSMKGLRTRYLEAPTTMPPFQGAGRSLSVNSTSSIANSERQDSISSSWGGIARPCSLLLSES